MSERTLPDGTGSLAARGCAAVTHGVAGAISKGFTPFRMPRAMCRREKVYVRVEKAAVQD
jgi:hypothetical protein